MVVKPSPPSLPQIQQHRLLGSILGARCMSPHVIVDFDIVWRYNTAMIRMQDPDLADRLGDAIIARREWLAISQADLAERLEISPSQMGRYERAVNEMSATMLARIATALGTTPNVLLNFQTTDIYTHAHIEEAHHIMADPHIQSVIQAMLTLDAIERRSLAKIVDSFCESHYEH
jgi:transcriptional regulator with XRE-family HTH domain